MFFTRNYAPGISNGKETALIRDIIHYSLFPGNRL